MTSQGNSAAEGAVSMPTLESAPSSKEDGPSTATPGTDRRDVKKTSLSHMQDERQRRRRRQLISSQKRRRRDMTALVRDMTSCAGDDDESSVPITTTTTTGVAMDFTTYRDPARGKKHSKKRPLPRQLFEHAIMLPEWMCDVPRDLGLNWLVKPRPEGKRCLVVAGKGMTVSRKRGGVILHKFPSTLPCGSRATQRGSDACILDCIFQEQDQTYYVLDIMCWSGYLLYDCTPDFRFFWVQTKLLECEAITVSSSNRYRFVPVPFHACDGPGLTAAYKDDYGFIKDGLLFYNKHATYEGGLSPLTHVWKDAASSRYHIDTTSDGSGPAPQQVISLLLDANRVLLTSDVPPIPLGQVPPELCQQHNLTAGQVLRFTITSAQTLISPHTGALVPSVQGLQYFGTHTRHRQATDSWSKILFQHRMRTSPIDYDQLLQVAVQPEAIPDYDTDADTSIETEGDDEGDTTLLDDHGIDANRMAVN